MVFQKVKPQYPMFSFLQDFWLHFAFQLYPDSYVSQGSVFPAVLYDRLSWKTTVSWPMVTQAIEA